MTAADARRHHASALIHLLQRYTERALGASLIVVQKLLYFLQVAGEPLQLSDLSHAKSH